MAQIITDTITLTFNRLVKDTAEPETVFTAELLADIEAAASALAGSGVVVEIASYSSDTQFVKSS